MVWWLRTWLLHLKEEETEFPRRRLRDPGFARAWGGYRRSRGDAMAPDLKSDCVPMGNATAAYPRDMLHALSSRGRMGVSGAVCSVLMSHRRERACGIGGVGSAKKGELLSET